MPEPKDQTLPTPAENEHTMPEPDPPLDLKTPLQAEMAELTNEIAALSKRVLAINKFLTRTWGAPEDLSNETP